MGWLPIRRGVVRHGPPTDSGPAHHERWAGGLERGLGGGGWGCVGGR